MKSHVTKLGLNEFHRRKKNLAINSLLLFLLTLHQQASAELV